MNSLNHYAYGAIGKWLYSTVAGIDIDEEYPGYKNIIIKPHPGGGLTHAKAEINTMYGVASSSWEMEGDQILLNIVIPVNSISNIYLPVNDLETVVVDDKSVTENSEVNIVRPKDGRPYIKSGSGSYKMIFKHKTVEKNK